MIIPAIDLLDKRVVRLFQGDYSKTRFYDLNPVDQVQKYTAAGAEIVHIIDLEGARDAENRQLELIKQIVAGTDARLQVGGGIRSVQDVDDLLTIGVERVIIGSLAINEPDLVGSWMERFGNEHIVLALDVSIDKQGNKTLPTKGWQKDSGKSLEQTLDSYSNAKHILCTDISKDGTLTGSNTALYKDVVKVYSNLKWQASGGTGTLDDIAALPSTGVTGVIVGRALLDGKFTLEEAIQCWRDA
jgi:phosphoribosylformimino-5-aminoimidazole carboxamide ribotide isomerase